MQLKNINILRGIAAISVTYFHLSNSANLSKGIASSGHFGFLGVEVFFVISGFILPYSMYKRGYAVADFYTFMKKRILRIYPAYLFIILIAVVLMALSKRPIPDWKVLIPHLIYFNSILGKPWISPVFWTLALEFQFYVVIGLLFSAFTSKSHLLLLFVIGSILAGAFLLSSSFLPHWFGMFALGLILFRKIELKMPTFLFWGVTFSLTLFIAYVNGPLEAFTCICTVLFLLYIPVNKETFLSKIFLWLGSISYSLYLTHWDFGRLGVAIFRHVPLIGKSEYIRLFFGLGLSLIVAYIFYCLIEKPFIRLSHKLISKKQTGKLEIVHE